MRVSLIAIALSLTTGIATAQDLPDLTNAALSTALAAKPEGAEAERLADRIRDAVAGAHPVHEGWRPRRSGEHPQALDA